MRVARCTHTIEYSTQSSVPWRSCCMLCSCSNGIALCQIRMKILFLFFFFFKFWIGIMYLLNATSYMCFVHVIMNGSLNLYYTIINVPYYYYWNRFDSIQSNRRKEKILLFGLFLRIITAFDISCFLPIQWFSAINWPWGYADLFGGIVERKCVIRWREKMDKFNCDCDTYDKC